MVESARAARETPVAVVVGRRTRRFAVQILGDEGVEDEEDEAGNEEEEREGADVVEFGPVVVAPRAARRLRGQVLGVDAVLGQPDHRTVVF